MITDVDEAGPGDAKFRPVGVEFAVVHESAVVVEACQRARTHEGGVVDACG